MTIKELNRAQLRQVKCQYLDNFLCDHEGRGISYWEMANIDIEVPDEEIFEEYAEYEFTEDDFPRR